MNSKLFGLFAFSILAFVLVMSFASSALTVSSSTINAPTSNSTIVTVNNTESTAATLSASGDFTVSLSSPSVPANTAVNITVTLTSDFNTLEPLTNVVTITATAGTVSGTGAVTIVKSLCSASNPGDLKVRGVDFTNNGLEYANFGEDDQWFPFDEITAEIEVENNGNDNVDDVSVQWGIYDNQENQWVIEMDEEDEINIKDGETETLTTTFKFDDDMDLDLDQLGDQSDRYRFYVVAEGTVDNSNSTDTCISGFESVSAVVESDFVVLDNFEIPETISCGATLEVSADVWNVGDGDQDEVSVYVTNKELGLTEDILVGDVDSFDSQKISFTFTVPRNVAEKTYNLKFEVYNEDGDVYQNDFNDDDSIFMVPLAVAVGCTGSTAPVTVNAEIVSGGKAGQDLVIKATLTNTGSNTASYTITATGHEEWAASYVASPSTLTLAAGATGETTYTFKVNSGASGAQTFNMELVSGTQVTKQPVSVMIEQGSFFGSMTGGAIGANGLVWGLGILIVILIIVIVLVVVLRRK